MSDTISGAVDTEHVMDVPNDGGIEEKEKNPEGSMTPQKKVSKDACSMTKKVACSEGFLLLLGLTGVALDPLFFYVPVMKNNNNSTCLGLDKTMIIVVVILRTFVDILHDWSWWSKSCYGKSQKSKKVTEEKQPYGHWKRIEWFKEWFKTCKISSPKGRSSLPAYIIAILACLPLPQVVVLAVDLQSHLKTWLKFGVICQFVPRIFRIYPTYVAVTASSDVYTWIGAAFNLLLYVLASHALGGFWYICAVERKMTCMKGACRDRSGCTISSLYCESRIFADNGFINDICGVQPTSNATTPFDYGMYREAIKSNVIGSKNFIDKLIESFWWGIKNLSSTAQNLELVTILDTCFAILICILGLILFALLIGNLQLYLQSKRPSILARLREKREELDKWAPFSSLPRHLREEVRMCEHHKWQKASEVNLESLLNNVPRELKKKLKPHFCNTLFDKVEEFKKLDPQIIEELRERATAVVFPARTNIYQEGYPISEMIHIVRGKAVTYNNDDVKKELPAKELKGNDSFGEMLLQRALESPLPKLPPATQTVLSVTKVEAFALSFDDFATIFTKHGRTIEAYKKVWAANTIKGALRRKYPAVKKVEKSLLGGKK